MILIVGLPAYGCQVDVRLAVSLFGLGTVLQNRAAEWARGTMLVDSCFISHARNTLVHQAMQRVALADPTGEADAWLLMIDADTYAADPVPVVTMVQTGISMGAAVIAAPVARRSGELNAKAGGRPVQTSQLGRVMPVDLVGAAFMAVNLAWLKLRWPRAPWFTIDHPPSAPGDPPNVRGEDFRFCQRVGELGGLILLDGRFQPTHIKPPIEAGYQEGA